MPATAKIISRSVNLKGLVFIVRKKNCSKNQNINIVITVIKYAFMLGTAAHLL